MVTFYRPEIAGSIKEKLCGEPFRKKGEKGFYLFGYFERVEGETQFWGDQRAFPKANWDPCRVVAGAPLTRFFEWRMGTPSQVWLKHWGQKGVYFGKGVERDPGVKKVPFFRLGGGNYFGDPLGGGGPSSGKIFFLGVGASLPHMGPSGVKICGRGFRRC